MRRNYLRDMFHLNHEDEKMKPNEDEFVINLKDKLKNHLLRSFIQRKHRVFIEVEEGNHKHAAELLRENFNAHLTTITARDAHSEFEVIYHFDIGGILISVKTLIPKTNPELDTISDIIPSGDWYEREIMDLFGIKFRGHPNPKRIILPDDWPRDNYPLRAI